MIEMPRRSVTRFFIPLIDVLLLLFVIFLLMPLGNEEDLNKSKDSSQNLTEEVEALEQELQELRKKLLEYRDLEPKLKDMQKLEEENERLKAAAKKYLQEKAAFQVIDVDDKTGSIYFYDPAKADMPRVPLDSEAAVKDLIERHKRENPGRDLYYFFLYPRPAGGFPTITQERAYQRWFRSVAHSLKEAGS